MKLDFRIGEEVIYTDPRTFTSWRRYIVYKDKRDLFNTDYGIMHRGEMTWVNEKNLLPANPLTKALHGLK